MACRFKYREYSHNIAMLVYAFMLMLMYCSAEKIYLKFISTKDGACDILELSSPCDGCFKYFYDMLQSIDIETVKIIKDYKIERISAEEIDMCLKGDDQSFSLRSNGEDHVVSKKSEDKNIMMITLPVSRSLYHRVVSISIFNDMPLFTTTELHYMVRYLYFFLDNKLQMQYALLFYIRNNTVTWNELFEMDKNERSAGRKRVSPLGALLFETKDNFMYIYKNVNGSMTCSPPINNFNNFDNRVPLIIDREHPALAICIENISVDIDFLIRNEEDIAKIFYRDRSIGELTLEVNINEYENSAFEKYRRIFVDALIKDMSKTFFGRGKYKKLILNFERVLSAVYCAIIPADSYVIRFKDGCSYDNMEMLPTNIVELSVTRSMIDVLVVSGNLEKLILEDVDIEVEVHFSEQNSVKNAVFNEVRGIISLRLASQLESLELLGENKYLELCDLNMLTGLKSLTLGWKLHKEHIKTIQFSVFVNLTVFSLAGTKTGSEKSSTPLPCHLVKERENLPIQFELECGCSPQQHVNSFMTYKCHSVLYALSCRTNIESLDISRMIFFDELHYEILGTFCNLKTLIAQFVEIDETFFENIPLSLRHLDISFTVCEFKRYYAFSPLRLDTFIMHPLYRPELEDEHEFDVFRFVNTVELKYLDIGNVNFNYFNTNHRFYKLKTLIIRNSKLTSFWFDTITPNVEFLCCDKYVELNSNDIEAISKCKHLKTFITDFKSTNNERQIQKLARQPDCFKSLIRIGRDTETMLRYMPKYHSNRYSSFLSEIFGFAGWLAWNYSVSLFVSWIDRCLSFL